MSTHLLHVYGCHQCSVALLCNAFSRNVCNRYDKCRLACNVCGGTTIVLYGRSCDLCILGIFGRSLFCGSLWIGMVSYLFYHLWKTTIVWTSVYSVVYISVLATSAPYFQHHTIVCSTEVSSASLLSSARSVTTSTNIDRHVTGIKYPYFNHKIVSRASSRFLANHIYMCFSQFRCPSVGHRISQFLTTHIPTVIHVC